MSRFQITHICVERGSSDDFDVDTRFRPATSAAILSGVERAFDARRRVPVAMTSMSVTSRRYADAPFFHALSRRLMARRWPSSFTPSPI